MSTTAFIICATWIAVAVATAAWRGRRGVREGRWPCAKRRLASPTMYLFAAYLLVAGVFTPKSEGETTTPLIWLGLAVPFAFVLATFSAIGNERPHRAITLMLAALHGGCVLAFGALILHFVSPQFVPAWLQ